MLMTTTTSEVKLASLLCIAVAAIAENGSSGGGCWMDG